MSGRWDLTPEQYDQPTTPSKPTRIVVSGQPWPVPPYDWEMAALDEADWSDINRKPSRLERLRRAFRMQP